MEGGAVGHNFEKDTPRDHLCQVWTLHRCFLPSLAPFGQAVSEEKIFLTLTNKKKDLILVDMFVFLIGYCLKKSSPLKLLGKMEPSLAGSIYVRSSIKLLHWPSCFRGED
jgi:hypothetical protein